MDPNSYMNMMPAAAWAPLPGPRYWVPPGALQHPHQQQQLQAPQGCANLQVGSSNTFPPFLQTNQFQLQQQQQLQPAGLFAATLGGPKATIATQQSSSQIPLALAAPAAATANAQQQQQQYLPAAQGYQQQPQQMDAASVGMLAAHEPADATVILTAQSMLPSAAGAAAGSPAAAAAAGAAGGCPAADKRPAKGDALLTGLHEQLLQQQQDAAAAAASNWPAQHLQQQQQDALLQLLPWGMPIEELQLLLPAVHAEYKLEMKLMLKACQVASNITRHSTATGSTLLLDPASREQLQRQVLSNCNEKHTAVTTAFKVAAHAVEAAATAAAGAGGSAGAGNGSSSSSKHTLGPLHPQQLQQQQQAAAAASGSAAASAFSSPEAQGTLNPGALGPMGLASQGLGGQGEYKGSMSHVWQCLQQLRSSYQQELVAATSALFAICRGFGQRYALNPAAEAAIQAALAAAQQQHGRVEQLWQDVVLVLAAGGA